MMQNTFASNKLFVHDDPTIAKKVQYYTEWLANDAKRNRIANSAQKIGEYEYIATQSTFVKGQETVTFRAFSTEFVCNADNDAQTNAYSMGNLCYLCVESGVLWVLRDSKSSLL